MLDGKELEKIFGKFFLLPVFQSSDVRKDLTEHMRVPVDAVEVKRRAIAQS